LRPFTVPASWIAPPKSSSFSVSVVLPASGWEMIAKVRRLATSRWMSGGKALSLRLSCGESLAVLAVGGGAHQEAFGGRKTKAAGREDEE
jgi:hypothetical protein